MIEELVEELLAVIINRYWSMYGTGATYW